MFLNDQIINIGEPSFGTMKFPIYGRLEEEDLKIVPHNIDILEDWQGHANVEWCGSAYTPVYLYKYIYKGKLLLSQTYYECH